MDFMSAKQAADLWGISQRRVAILCSEDRVEGAKYVGKMWLIPCDTNKPIDARSVRFQPKTPAAVKPFVKWAGGKAQILDNIKLKYPAGLGTTVTKYAEPFVGGGAVLFDILSNYELSEIYVSDTNCELIHTYTAIRNEIGDLIKTLKPLESEYLSACEESREDIYYTHRSRYNDLKLKNDNSPELAALFIFLNRTCFNGLYRVNSKGEFNVPQGRYKNPRICDEENLYAISLKLQNVKIVCGDYSESENFIDRKTFAYFDPPYRPLTTSASFTAYTQDGFGDEEQVELARFVDKMSQKGAFVVASNSDPKNTNKEDTFFDDLYSRHKVFRISASRAINSIGSKRGKINELLIASY